MQLRGGAGTLGHEAFVSELPLRITAVNPCEVLVTVQSHPLLSLSLQIIELPGMGVVVISQGHPTC